MGSYWSSLVSLCSHLHTPTIDSGGGGGVSADTRVGRYRRLHLLHPWSRSDYLRVLPAVGNPVFLIFSLFTGSSLSLPLSPSLNVRYKRLTREKEKKVRTNFDAH